ncbi:uncharacterized protein LOC112086706 [Eutrema salsugineum]|uniref:uncharacterized protein LOC112086706 n=1 Tax=Eutrema salsugineum TaxID=72664 RepID=UPI000CED336C|nr:uncharacterized protein LOC112086706 [Eutrema salsugineum]
MRGGCIGENNVQGGIRVEDKEFVVVMELLMMQMLKLDEIEAEGELRVQRKMEILLPSSLFSLCFFCEIKQSNDVFEFLFSGLPCPELCGVVGNNEGEKPGHELQCNLAGFAFAKLQRLQQS